MSQPSIDLDAMRRALAMQGTFCPLGEPTETSCTFKFTHRDGREYISHQATEAECIRDIEKRIEGIML